MKRFNIVSVSDKLILSKCSLTQVTKRLPGGDEDVIKRLSSGCKEVNMEDNKIIVTISGTDKVGIVADVTAVLAKYAVNIEDIKQTIMQGHFVMFLLGNIEDSTYSFKEIKEASITAKSICSSRSTPS